MMRGVYLGPIQHLQGKTALLQRKTWNKNVLHAQFDDMSLTYNGEKLGFGWHKTLTWCWVVL